MIYNVKNKIRNLSHRNEIFKQMYSLANKIKIGILYIVSDEKFAKIKYKENTALILNIENPTTFNEKLWWLKLNNRDPLLTICSDKYKVRDYVKQCGLEHILTKLHGVYNNANEINFDELPSRAFIKTNHGSGINIIWDRNKPFNEEKFRKKFNKALKQNYYWQSREWNYKNIEPMIIVEEILENKRNVALIDYRFLCFNGVAKMIFVDIETSAEDGSHSPYAKRNVYDKDFNYMDIKVKREQFDTLRIIKPSNFDNMIKYAEKLSEPFPFCRVDLYNINGDIYFGEITFYPGGGTQIIEPHKWEVKAGEWIDINSSKIVLSKGK